MFFALPAAVAVVAAYIQLVFLRHDGNPIFRPMVWNALEDLKSIVHRRMRMTRTPTRQLAAYWTRLISGSASNTSTTFPAQRPEVVGKPTTRASDMCEVPAPTFPAAAFHATIPECPYSHEAYVNHLVVFAFLGGIMLPLVYLWRRLENSQSKFDSVNSGAQPSKTVRFVELNGGLTTDSADTDVDTTMITLLGGSGSNSLLDSCEIESVASRRWTTAITTDSRLIFPNVPHLDGAALVGCRILDESRELTTQKPTEPSKRFKLSPPMIHGEDPAPILPWIENDGVLGASYVAQNMVSESIIIPTPAPTPTSVEMNRETHMASPAIARPAPLILPRPNPDVSEPLGQSGSTESQISGYSTSPVLSDPETPDPSEGLIGAGHLGPDFSHQQGAKLSPQNVAQEIKAFQDSAAHPSRPLSALASHSCAPWSHDAWGEDDRDTEVLSTVAQPPTPGTDARTIMVDSDVDYEEQTIRDSDSAKVHDISAGDFGMSSIDLNENPSTPSSASASGRHSGFNSWLSERYAQGQLTMTPSPNTMTLPDYGSDRVFAAQLFTSRLRQPLESPLDKDVVTQQGAPPGGELEDATLKSRRNENPGPSRSISQSTDRLNLPQDPVPTSTFISKSTPQRERPNKSRAAPMRQPTAPSSLPGFNASHASRTLPKSAIAAGSKQGTDQSVWAHPSDSDSHGPNSRSWRHGYKNQH